MPTNNTDSHEDNDSYNERKSLFIRDIESKIDGSIHHVKAAGVTYRQRIKNNQCLVEYDNQFLSENEVIKIRKKVFRVENCLLERVYHACGPNLLLMLSVVCRVVEQHSPPNSLTNFKRETSLTSDYYYDDSTILKSKRVITESCCENLCSVSELSRYCHQ